jgi:hypothetical protein
MKIECVLECENHLGEGLAIDDRHGSRRGASPHRQSAFELGHAFERCVPARLELRSYQPVVGIHGLIASGSERRLVLGLFQLQRQRAVLVVAARRYPAARRDLRGQSGTAPVITISVEATAALTSVR